MAKLVILSPHLDDAVYSCWHGVQKAEMVLTVFSGMPPKGTRTLWDMASGQPDSRKLMAKRFEENLAALGLSGSGCRPEYLNLLDSQYRKRALNPRDKQLPEIKLIAKEILKKCPNECVFLAPLAASRIARHPDHVLLRKAAVLLREQGHKVQFYTDAPYMLLPPRFNNFHKKRLLAAARNVLGREVKATVHTLTPEQHKQKIEAVRAAYRSQYWVVNINSFGRLGRVVKRNYEVTVT